MVRGIDDHCSPPALVVATVHKYLRNVERSAKSHIKEIGWMVIKSWDTKYIYE